MAKPKRLSHHPYSVLHTGADLAPFQAQSQLHHFALLVAKYYRVILLFVALATLYLCALLLIPGSVSVTRQYGSHPHPSPLILAIYLPYVCVWFIALLGYLGLRDYVAQIASSRDGDAFRSIAHGMFVLMFWFPASAALTLLTAHYAGDSLTAPLVARIATYANLTMLLLAFSLVYAGSRKLLAVIQRPEPAPFWGSLVYVAFAALYTFLAFQDPTRNVIAASAPVGARHLSDTLILTTVVVPRLICWYIGLQAAHNLYAYRKHVGKIYKEALTSLAVGIASLVFLTIVIRTFQVLLTLWHRPSLIGVLLVMYGLMAITGTGYLLIARGAHRLHRIEKL